MNHTLKDELVEVFRQNGADLVRFGNVERFENEAVREIFPETKTVIGAAFGLMNGLASISFALLAIADMLIS